jgi:hypothetical protein
MNQRPVARRFVLLLVAGLLVLPIAAWAIVAVSSLVGVMGDTEGEILLCRLAWGCGVVWIVDLVALVVVQAVNSLGDGDRRQ